MATHPEAAPGLPAPIDDERAPLLPSSSRPTTPAGTASLPNDDPLSIDVKKKLTKVDIAWRVVLALFAGLLLGITIKAIVDTDHPDVRYLSSGLLSKDGSA